MGAQHLKHIAWVVNKHRFCHKKLALSNGKNIQQKNATVSSGWGMENFGPLMSGTHIING